MQTEPLPPELTKLEYYKPEVMLGYAFDIKQGKAGGEYFYSLEEDYIYVYEEGYWKKIKDKQFQDRIEKGLGILTTLKIQQRREVIENFKVKRHLSIESLNKESLINFKNCMFLPTAQQKFPHAREYYSTIRLPYEYDPEATCPLWLKTLNEVLEGDKEKISAFQEFIGYCLIPETNQKKALLLLGESNSGKSTLLFIVKDLIGSENVSNVPLQYLSNPQYTPLLINKMVNIDADVAKDAAKYEREFKIITSGEAVSCNQKHIPTFEFIPKCKIILAANEFPRITDHSNAFYNRLILIPCNRVFQEQEQNKTLVAELKKELPGIFNWAIEGLKTFKNRGSFKQYEFIKEAVQELEDENNPSNLFFEEHVEIFLSDGCWIEKTELFQKYKNWCGDNKQYNLSHIQFSQCVMKKFGRITPKDARLPNNGSRIWKNLKFVHFKNGAPIIENNRSGEELY